jgi:hypothetical protein
MPRVVTCPVWGFLCSLYSLAAELIPACFQNALGFPKPLKRLAGTDDNKTPEARC